MERRQIGLKLVLKELGIDPDMGDFEKRLILQKAIYLAQSAGVQLGYFYRWYLRGPYCPALADDGFALSISGPEDPGQGWVLDDHSKKILPKVRALINQHQGEDLARHLELLASALFLIDSKQASQEEVALTEKLKQSGKPYSQPEVKKALGELTEHGFLH